MFFYNEIVVVVVGCFLFFTQILKIFVILFCSIKISCIFVKEITTKTIEIMTTTEILTKANELVRNANFTKVVKSRSNAGACFLIVALNDGSAFYGSYSSEAVYFVANNGDRFGLRK